MAKPKVTAWEVERYGADKFAVVRYIGRCWFEWLGGKTLAGKPKVVYGTLEEARTARDMANGPKVPVSSCCGAVLVPEYKGREITRYRCPCGKVQR